MPCFVKPKNIKIHCNQFANKNNVLIADKGNVLWAYYTSIIKTVLETGNTNTLRFHDILQ